MEIVKKFGLWVVAAIIAIAAVAVYVLFVHGMDVQVQSKRAVIEDTRNKLQDWARKGKDIPNPKKIEIAKKNGEQVAAVLDECELYLAQQPRWAHTIRFFLEGTETQVSLEAPNDWLLLYRKYNRELQNQIAAAGLSYSISTKEGSFSGRPPTIEEMGDSMELYWFQKDLIDFLTNQVEKDFAAYLELKARDRTDPFPAKPYDLVVNRTPGRLDSFLRDQKREKLAAVLGAIVVNREQEDLPTIFNRLLPDETVQNPDGTAAIVYGFPWERPASDKEHESVRGLTMDEAQEKFLAEMLPAGKPDLSDRERFQNYVMELRTVRYRADVIGLLESHHFDSLAVSLRRGTETELNDILSGIADVNGVWTRTRIAEAISAIVSINNESDFLLVRNNHAPNVAALISLNITSVGESQAPARGDMYKLRPFEMTVKLEFARIPVFLRRLISNSWHYRVVFTEIAPAAANVVNKGQGIMAPPGALPGMLPGGPPGGFPGPAAPAAPSAPAAAGAPDADAVEAGNFIVLKLNADAYQFTPLMNKYRDKLENRAAPAAPAAAGTPAAPTGAR